MYAFYVHICLLEQHSKILITSEISKDLDKELQLKMQKINR